MNCTNKSKRKRAFSKYVVSKNTNSNGVINTKKVTFIKNTLFLASILLLLTGLIMLPIGLGTNFDYSIQIPIVFYMSFPIIAVAFLLFLLYNGLPNFTKDGNLIRSEICPTCGARSSFDKSSCVKFNTEGVNSDILQSTPIADDNSSLHVDNSTDNTSDSDKEDNTDIAPTALDDSELDKIISNS